jgi:ATP-dependent DNA helicase RecG
MTTGFSESDVIEFKERWRDDALEDIAALANTRGGTLYIGVRDDGFVVGLSADDISDDAQQRIAGKVQNQLHLSPELRVERYEAKNVLVITVPQTSFPVLLRGSYWTRVGTTSSKVAPAQWTRLVLTQTGRDWESLPAPVAITSVEGQDILDTVLDLDLVRQYVLTAQSFTQPRLPIAVPADAAARLILDSLELLTPDGTPTNAAVLLFGRAPQRIFPQARVRIAYFRSINDFDEHPPATGTVFEQIMKATSVLETYAPIRMTFPTPRDQDQLRRRATPTYPASVLREAVTNAVIHRDYLSSDDIQIKVFADRFEIWNPGGLAPDLRLDELYGPHRSLRRNRRIAEAAYYTYVVERWGTGTTRMVDACRTAGLPIPQFEEQSGGFLVTLHREALSESTLVQAGLNSRQVKAILSLGLEGTFTTAEYRQLTDATKTTAERDIKALETAGFVRRIGAGRDTRYVVETTSPTP